MNEGKFTMDSIFVNIYIEKLLTQLTEMMKTLMLKESHIAYLEKINSELQEKIEKNNENLEKNDEKIKTSKRNSKEKDLNTF